MPEIKFLSKNDEKVVLKREEYDKISSRNKELFRQNNEKNSEIIKLKEKLKSQKIEYESKIKILEHELSHTSKPAEPYNVITSEVQNESIESLKSEIKDLKLEVERLHQEKEISPILPSKEDLSHDYMSSTESFDEYETNSFESNVIPNSNSSVPQVSRNYTDSVLTQREQDILTLLSRREFTLKGIAEEFGTTPTAISNSLCKIRAKGWVVDERKDPSMPKVFYVEKSKLASSLGVKLKFN